MKVLKDFQTFREFLILNVSSIKLQILRLSLKTVFFGVLKIHFEFLAIFNLIFGEQVLDFMPDFLLKFDSLKMRL